MDNTNEITDFCFVITGLLKSEYISDLIKSYIGVKNKIISTWKDQDNKFINLLEENGFLIVLNDHPVYDNHTFQQRQTIYQNTTIKSGCIKALELGFKYAIRMRTDVICNNIKLFRDMLGGFDKDKITVFSAIDYGNSHFYFLDVMLSGKIDHILKMVTPDVSNKDERFVEKIWMYNYTGENITDLEKFKQYFHICLEECRKTQLDFYWYSHSRFIISCYCNSWFILV